MGEWYKLYSGVYGSIFISYSIGKHEIRRIISATQMQRKKIRCICVGRFHWRY